jgi:cold-inducible RNA-binding protein
LKEKPISLYLCFMKLFVGGLTGYFDDTDLREMFELYGEVTSALIIQDRQTGKSKGFGFVVMPNNLEAKETISLLDGASMFGKKIAVKEADEQPKSGPDNRRNNNNNNNRQFR